MLSISRRSLKEATNSSRNGHSDGASHDRCMLLRKVCSNHPTTLIIPSSITDQSALPQYISPRPNDSPYVAAATAISVAHVSHLLSVLILYHLSRGIFAGAQRGPHAFVTAILHIISPAGLFLSAPYTESLFSCLTIAGLMFYRKGLVHTYIEGSSDNARDLNTLVSSIFFGLATTVRGNGLLNGTLFIYDVLMILPSLWELKFNFSQFRRLATLGAAGAVVAIGGLLPQWVAYQEYCQPISNDVKLRSWCYNTIPSIYVWVQSNYWYIGYDVLQSDSSNQDVGMSAFCDIGQSPTCPCSCSQHQCYV